MDIGAKLKNARQRANLTQEQSAEAMNVSRQTISNWENNRCYPDIMHVIDMSDLYGVSLDELLNQDEDMLIYLRESTDTVKSRQKVSRRILVGIYLLIWSMLLIWFWMGGASDAMGYSLVAFYLVLPVTTAVVSFFIGKDSGWGESRWLMLLFFGLMFMLITWGTFSMANMKYLDFTQVRLPNIGDMLPGIFCSALGMLVGTLVRKGEEKRDGFILFRHRKQ